MTKVVILCGGKGTRLREETEYKPKPLVEIGGLPILWHIMKIYGNYGFNEFVLCLGYKGRQIKQFFMDYEWDAFDFTMNLRSNDQKWHATHKLEDWTITFAETGQETMTGGRIKKIKKYVGKEPFMLTYGDGVADIDVKKLLAYHKKMGKLATVTVVHPQSKFGIIKSESNTVEFVEKPPLKDWINGGFMVLEPEVFDMLDNDMFEQTTLPALAKKGELATYMHEGFWHAMDTYKDYLDLNKLWSDGKAEWKVWKNDFETL